MSYRIQEFALPTDKNTVINMPAEAQILSLGEHLGYLKLWALVNPDTVKVERTFSTYTSNSTIEDHPGKYIGSVTIGHSVPIALHVFEVVNS